MLKNLGNNIQLIDAGTGGLSGNIESQYSFSRNNAHLCCRKENKEIIPVCTLRSSPKSINHCIAFGLQWIKHSIFEENNELSDFPIINVPIQTNQIQNTLKLILKNDYKINDNLQGKTLTIYDTINLQNAYQTFANILTNQDLFRQLKQDKSYSKDNQTIAILLASITFLRAFSFQIECKLTPFQIQQIANKIVPAISFSNGLVANISCQLIGNKDDQQIFITNGMGINNLIIHDKIENKNEECEYCSQKMYVINSNDLDKLQEIFGYPIYIYKETDNNQWNLILSLEDQNDDSGWDDSSENQKVDNKEQFSNNLKALQKDIVYKAVATYQAIIIYFTISDDYETKLILDHQTINNQEESIDLSSDISIL